MTRRPHVARPLLLLLASVLLLASCGGAAEGAGDDGTGRLRIATTVAPITSIVANVAGERAEVTGIVPEGTDSHTFEPRPSVAELLSTVDVVFVNGLGLEEPTTTLARAHGAEVVALGDAVLPEEEWIFDSSFPEEEGRPNPHLWTDPGYAVAYAEVVAEDLAARDPDNASYYRANLDELVALVDRFDAAMRRSFATVPPQHRRLLTYHDAYAYFARSYGWEVIGAIQVASFEDPTPRELAALIEQVEASGVPAIFGSEVFPSPVLEQIGRETGVEYVDVLRDDDLPGGPGDADHSWLGLMRFDFVTMTAALGGDPSALEEFEVRNVAPDRAEYPQ